MQFAVSPKLFRATLQLVQQSAMPDDAIIPAACGVLVESEGGALRLTSTNLTTSLSTTVPLSGSTGTMSTLVDAKLLIQLLGTLPAKQDAHFRFDYPDLLTCASGTAQYRQSVNQSTDFPRPKPVQAFGNRATLPVLHLAKALRTALPFVLSKNNTAYASYSAVLLRLAGSVATLQATSGFSAASTQLRFIETSGPAKLLLPLQSVRLLLAQLELAAAGEVVVNWNENNAEFSFGHPLVRLSTQLVDDTMPDIDNLFIEDERRTTITISRPALQLTLLRLKPYTKTKGRLSFSPDTVTVEAGHPEWGYEGTEWLPAVVPAGAALLPLNFNLPYLLKMVEVLDTPEVALSVAHVQGGMLRVLPGLEASEPLLFNTSLALSTLPEEEVVVPTEEQEAV
ncbi:hypothetical protein [Hymenobacter algoricola]|uniref:Beta sliding clamp n=1 Tax=Hymenobacter algoricola TaxID=486267 RepID=A0ABP7N9J5_9BACT